MQEVKHWGCWKNWVAQRVTLLLRHWVQKRMVEKVWGTKRVLTVQKHLLVLLHLRGGRCNRQKYNFQGVRKQRWAKEWKTTLVVISG